MAYQLDHGCRQLLLLSKDRTATSFNTFFDMLGDERSRREFVASDMWQAFLSVVRARCSDAIHWLEACGRFALGATEGFNDKARITTRKAYGFRTYEHARIAPYHALGDLPVPDWLTHRFV